MYKVCIHFTTAMACLMLCVSNDWSPMDANPAIRLYETWTNILPPFIRDNVLDQLILPKVQKGIVEWQPRSGGPTLQAMIFPWLPHVGLRIELLDEAKRKVKALLRNWMVGDGLPKDLIAWKDVCDSAKRSDVQILIDFRSSEAVIGMQ